MQTFQFAGPALIERLNIRKERKIAERILSVDVRFTGYTHDASLCDFFDPMLRGFLFIDEVIARAPAIKMRPIGFGIEVEHCDLDLLGRLFHDVRLRQFRVAGMDGGNIEIQFVASFAPSKDEIAVIAEYVKEEVPIQVRPQPQLDFGDTAPMPAAGRSLSTPGRSRRQPVPPVADAQPAPKPRRRRHLRDVSRNAPAEI